MSVHACLHRARPSPAVRSLPHPRSFSPPEARRVQRARPRLTILEAATSGCLRPHPIVESARAHRCHPGLTTRMLECDPPRCSCVARRMPPRYSRPLLPSSTEHACRSHRTLSQRLLGAYRHTPRCRRSACTPSSSKPASPSKLRLPASTKPVFAGSRPLRHRANSHAAAVSCAAPPPCPAILPAGRRVVRSSQRGDDGIWGYVICRTRFRPPSLRLFAPRCPRVRYSRRTSHTSAIACSQRSLRCAVRMNGRAAPSNVAGMCVAVPRSSEPATRVNSHDATRASTSRSTSLPAPLLPPHPRQVSTCSPSVHAALEAARACTEVHAALEAARACTEQMLAAALLETVQSLGRLPGSSLRADGYGRRARPFSLEITGIFHGTSQQDRGCSSCRLRPLRRACLLAGHALPPRRHQASACTRDCPWPHSSMSTSKAPSAPDAAVQARTATTVKRTPTVVQYEQRGAHLPTPLRDGRPGSPSTQRGRSAQHAARRAHAAEQAHATCVLASRSVECAAAEPVHASPAPSFMLAPRWLHTHTVLAVASSFSRRCPYIAALTSTTPAHSMVVTAIRTTRTSTRPGRAEPPAAAAVCSPRWPSRSRRASARPRVSPSSSTRKLDGIRHTPSASARSLRSGHRLPPRRRPRLHPHARVTCFEFLPVAALLDIDGAKRRSREASTRSRRSATRPSAGAFSLQ
ncbi:hypothetical protein K438DRAFT_1961222 [Mycena galopus ATCC 62051]|nr:hypothetical protein K438DRAFT_1961222 [Mycena galopus ATCC 62051]